MNLLIVQVRQTPSIIWDEIKQKRKNVNTAIVDRPAGKINTEWTSTVDGQKAAGIEASQKARRKERERGHSM